MKKTTKIALAAATLWPFLYICIFFVFVFSNFFLVEAKGKPFDPKSFSTLMLVHMITIMWMFALFVIYLVHLFKNGEIKQDQKALWAVLLFVGNVIAMPIYWYFHIWRKPEVSS